MSELDKLISELAATARNTREAVRKAKEETGKELSRLEALCNYK